MAIDKQPVFEWRGVKDVVAARLIRDDAGGIEWEKPFYIAGAAELGRTTENSSETHYYDDSAAIVIDSVGADTVTVSMSAIPLDIMAKITGQFYDEELGAFVEGQRESDYFALGYITDKTNNKPVYVWRYKGKFSIPDSTHTTKTNGTEANGQEIVFTGIDTTHVFNRTGKVGKAINIDTEKDKADVMNFFDQVQTIDTVKAKMSEDVMTVVTGSSADVRARFLGVAPADMVENDVRVLADGTVLGTLKNVTGYTGFSSVQEEQSGHFFPFTLTKTGTKMTIKTNGTAAPNKTDLPFDPDVVLKVDKNKKFSIDVDGVQVVALDFTNTTLA